LQNDVVCNELGKFTLEQSRGPDRALYIDGVAGVEVVEPAAEGGFVSIEDEEVEVSVLVRDNREDGAGLAAAGLVVGWQSVDSSDGVKAAKDGAEAPARASVLVGDRCWAGAGCPFRHDVILPCDSVALAGFCR